MKEERAVLRRFYGEGGGFWVFGRFFPPDQKKIAQAFADGYNLALKRTAKLNPLELNNLKENK